MAPLPRLPGIGRQLVEQLAQAGLVTEVLYSFVIITVSLMIYFGTHEFYNLSSHKGIKYFRLAFLFFAIAFFFRSFIKFLLIFFNSSKALELSIQGAGGLSLLFFMYASSMAVFYLLYSVMWKKWNSDKIVFFHILAFVIGAMTLALRSPSFILVTHIVLFLFIILIIVLSYIDLKLGKKKNHLHGIYLLLLAFWILNIIDLVITNVLGAFQLLTYLASISIFLAILYRVLRKLG